MLFVYDGPVAVGCNVVCNEEPVFHVYGDIRTQILCKYYSKLKMNQQP